MNAPEDDVETIFHAALELQPGKERDDFLDGKTPEITKRVRRLLEMHEAGGGCLSIRLFSEDSSSIWPPTEQQSESIGPYKLLQQIGEGGFGIVWMAEQERPVRRQVALKIIKLGMETKEVIARFEQERQALAMMEHPNIAKVFDAGATSAGRPFFVMELVRGTKITDYCDDHSLTTDARIDLFIRVCQAVQHAHQKGVIHRDLKPSNILVTIQDGEAEPKVIDFGVAKATQGRITEGTLFTRFEQMIGTPLYMSPEQAELTSWDIDTRSDIYSLGVLLYELLTGSTPIATQTMARAGMDEIRRIIREVDPPRPSARIRTLDGNSLTTGATRRHTDAAKLPGTLRGDLDWIVMKCLEKDRKRRYDTANGLALDLKRHIANEIVTARPPTAGYLLGRLVRRNKLAVAAGAMIAAVLILGIAASTWQAVRATRAVQRSSFALHELRATAPAFAEQARALAATERFDEAIEKLDYALKLRPGAPEYLVAKGDLLQCQLKLAAAAAVYREATRVKPGLVRAETSAKLCNELLAAPPDKDGTLSRQSLARLHLAMQEQQRPAAELMPVARLLGEEKKIIIEYWLNRLRGLPIPVADPLNRRLYVLENGLLGLDLTDTKINDLGPLVGMPLGTLILGSCQQITDFTLLRKFRTLQHLDLQNTRISDLAPLSGLPLEELYLTATGAFDLSALRGMKLRKLGLRKTRVADLSPLTGMPLSYLDATDIPAVDFSPLAGAPLERCLIQSSQLRDLSFLKGSPIKELIIQGSNEVRGYAVLAGLKSLNLLVLPSRFRSLPEGELKSIEMLRDHPSLRNIESVEARADVWTLETVKSKERFWAAWDLERTITKALRAGGFGFELSELPGGTYRLLVSGREFYDLSILKNVPISELVMDDTSVTNLSPIADLPLVSLSLDRTPVADLAPLGGLALKTLWLRETNVVDLSVLRHSPLCDALQEFWISKTKVTDFSPLGACAALTIFDATETGLQDLEPVRGRKLRFLFFASTRVRDISALAGMPLEAIFFDHTDVTDVTPLLQCRQIENLILPTAARHLMALRDLPRLKRVSYIYDSQISGPSMTAAEFWLKLENTGTSVSESN